MYLQTLVQWCKRHRIMSKNKHTLKMPQGTLTSPSSIDSEWNRKISKPENKRFKQSLYWQISKIQLWLSFSSNFNSRHSQNLPRKRVYTRTKMANMQMHWTIFKSRLTIHRWLVKVQWLWRQFKWMIRIKWDNTPSTTWKERKTSLKNKKIKMQWKDLLGFSIEIPNIETMPIIIISMGKNNLQMVYRIAGMMMYWSKVKRAAIDNKKIMVHSKVQSEI